MHCLTVFAALVVLCCSPALAGPPGGGSPERAAGLKPGQAVPAKPADGCLTAELRRDHAKLMVYATAGGHQRPVRTAEDWAIRRGQILEGMEAVFGELPDRSKLPPPQVKVIRRDVGEGFDRLEIAYRAEENDWVPADLYLPQGRPAGERLPAMLALQPTSRLGKRRVAGEASDLAALNRAYGKELAQRGYVVLAPDYPSFGDYACDFRTSKYASGSMKTIFNNMRGVDLLETREEVDPQRIGVIGHSLGGHNAMFTGVFDPRLRVIVSSCGWTPFHDYRGGKLAPWAQPVYAPRVRDVYACDPGRMPFDFYEVVAALAPRAFFSNSPLADSNFSVDGVKKAEPKAREVFALLGAAGRLQVRYPNSMHDFPRGTRREAYAFIDRVLQHTPARDIPAAAPPNIGSRMRVVDLKLGQEAAVKLADGQTAVVKLLAMNDIRDKVRGAVRRATVTVLVNGKRATLTSATYRLPAVVDNVRIDCPVTAAYRSNGDEPEVWGLEADARLRLWPAEGPLLPPDSMVYPVEQRWFACGTQMANETACLLYGEIPARKKIYYHYGLDMGGADQRVPVVAATDGLVVSAGGKLLEGERLPPQVRPRYDVVYLRDAQGWYYRYSHLDSIDARLKLGDRVQMGQPVGILGKEGGSGGWSHLHWDALAPQPSGRYGIVEAYVFLWEAYRQQWLPKLQAVARPHQLAWIGDPVVLDGSAWWSAGGQSHIVRYEWRLSDGASAVGPTVTRRYARPGTYSEVLKITDAEGNVDHDFAQVQIADPAHPDQSVPRPHAAYWPTRGLKAGDAVTFLVRSYCAPGEVPDEIWDFGDGTPAVHVHSDGNARKNNKTGYAVNVHRYVQPGRYLASVRRSNARGETGTAHLQVFVEPAMKSK